MTIHPKEIRPEIAAKQLLKGSKGSYKVLQSLGSGGNSDVYLVAANNEPLRGVLFALKLFVNVSNDVRLQRFRNEIKFLSECDHPSVMKVYDQGSFIDGFGEKQIEYPFVIADYLPKTLRDAMREGLSLVEKVAFSLQLVSGLAYLASKSEPITHRDIKPENIFVRGTSCVLGDFGLLKAGDGLEPSLEYHTEPSTGIRYPRLYPTPDLIAFCKNKSGEEKISPKSDVFQLGLVLSELYTGSLPIKERKDPYDPIEILALKEFPGTLSLAICNAIEKMLLADSNQRPHAKELFDKWEGILNTVARMATDLEGKVFR